jgi:thiopeptide-type bacteriocin biosynthesis protein
MSALGQRPGEWQAIHVFYGANPRPLLTQCIDPLVNGLVTDGLLSTYFFVNYWLEGPHVRLRLKPRTEADTAKVRARAQTAVSAFLEGRPTLYEVKPEYLIDFYETVFKLDYSADERTTLLRPDGSLRLRRNNTFSFERYEPEYGRYGGPAGVELAEWHFRHSSDLAIEASRSLNLRQRSVLLGLSAQLMMVMVSAFLREESAVGDFLQRYHAFWRRTFAAVEPAAEPGEEHDREVVTADVVRSFARIRAAFGSGGTTSALPGPLRSWAEHCVELRERAHDLAARGQLVFRSWGGPVAGVAREQKVTDPATALELLLSPYLRMCNNRLSVPMREETRLASVLARSLRESPALEAGA